jgi:hypothetical protein
VSESISKRGRAMAQPTSYDEIPAEAQEKRLGRRALLKALAASGGAVTAAMLLPGEWAKPVVEVGVLPAHAQVTPVAGDLDVALSWEDTGTFVDFELHVVDPADGTDLSGNTAGLVSATLQHSGNAPAGNNGTETVGNSIPGVLATGTYQIYLTHVSGPTTPGSYLDVTVTANGTPQTFNMLGVFGAPNESRRVADVTFPPGTVTDRVGDPYP